VEPHFVPRLPSIFQSSKIHHMIISHYMTVPSHNLGTFQGANLFQAGGSWTLKWSRKSQHGIVATAVYVLGPGLCSGPLFIVFFRLSRRSAASTMSYFAFMLYDLISKLLYSINCSGPRRLWTARRGLAVGSRVRAHPGHSIHRYTIPRKPIEMTKPAWHAAGRSVRLE
jgi:hypothetical protein